MTHQGSHHGAPDGGCGTLRHLRPPRALNPHRVVHLHSRPHIDLLRVAGALCRS
ncbi:putative leader peptide [Streptomyces umbrinus]|uniref:putative leader peptide n=1 Tax=Streptomyces umbrinus TaxID=67370 RepID=UPI003C2D21DF